MKYHWEELNSHRPMHVCTFPHPCRCESMRVARNFILEDQVIQFLTGLNDNYGVVMTHVLLMDHIPSINKVYSLVVQEDSSILVNAFKARKPSGRSKPLSDSSQFKNNYRYCTFCHKNNHTVDYCYQKHGYPNGNKGNSSSNAMNSDTASQSQVTTEGSSAISQTGLTQHQYVHLLSLLQQSSLLPSTSSINHANTNHVIALPSSMPSSSGINTVISCSLNVQPQN